MNDDVRTNSLEERRLALEERKAQQDYELRSLELSLRRAENGWLSRISPLTATVFAGILTFAGTAIAAYLQARSAQQQESEKEQHDLIVKMVAVADTQQSIKNLKFLADTGLLDPTLAKTISTYAATSTNIPVLPPSGGVTISPGSAFEAVRTDDDAINLILTWEGGFMYDPSHPDQATNGGITVSQLSSYLGRTATIDDLKGLTRSTIIDIYKKTYGPAIAGITAPLVRAAYFNLADWVGSKQAIQTLQTAAGRVLGKAVTADGIMGPDSASLMNSIPDFRPACRDGRLHPDRLVENVIGLRNIWKRLARAFARLRPDCVTRCVSGTSACSRCRGG